MTIRYRPEIDGLRAIAVLPVIAFHAGFKLFSGGFAGVDIFFVISGYLITSRIIGDLAAGQFSILDFYERRARRILPALFFVMACCILFAWAWMLPLDMKSFSASVAAVSVFASNFLFWGERDYFDTATELKLLLHTWSLAVEEQFYVIFPVLLVLLWRFGRRSVIPAIAIIAVVSLALSEHTSRIWPSANFYFLPTRAWELMAGALCAFIALKASPRRDNVIAAAGLAAIAAAIFLYDDTIPFPSLYALLPVLGSCAVILFAVEGTAARALLAAKPMAGIGLISYSAYLWHQPLFAFARLRALVEPDPRAMFLLAAASIALAYASWRYIEVPARRRGEWPLPNRRAVLATFGSAALIFIAFGIIGQWTKGYPARLSPELASLDDRIAQNRGLNKSCDFEFTLSSKCRTSETPEILLWGDSFAMQMLEGIKASAPSPAIIQLTKSVCAPFLGIAPTSEQLPLVWSKTCLRFNDQVREYFTRASTLRYAVLASPFNLYVGEKSRVLTGDGTVVAADQVAITAFRATLDTLIGAGITPVIIAPPPSPGFDAGRCLVNAALFGESATLCNFSLKDSVARQAEVRKFLAEIARDYRVIWLDSAVCDGDTCNAIEQGVFLYRDERHLSKEGSAYLGRKIHLYDLITKGAP